MAIPLPDHTGWQVTPTIHKAPYPAIDPSTTTLPSPFAICVFGASRGIGAHIAHAYAKAGASTVILVGRDASALEAVAHDTRQCSKKQDIQVLIALCDITSSSAVSLVADKVKQEVGRLDVLVISAAHFGKSEVRVTEGDTALFQNVINVDLVGAYLASHYLIPIILASDGSDAAKAVIAIGGGGAWITRGPIAHPAHCISKLGQARLMELIANDFAGEGLMVVTVRPGLVMTEGSRTAPEKFHPYLTDDVNLCGAFLVWLTKTKEDRLWMNGRFVSATWDVDELLSMREAIEEKDMLKARMVVR